MHSDSLIPVYTVSTQILPWRRIFIHRLFPPFSQSVTYFQCIPPLSGSTYVLQSPCFFTVEMCYSLGALKSVCVLQMTVSFCCECFLFCFAHVLKKHYAGQNVCVSAFQTLTKSLSGLYSSSACSSWLLFSSPLLAFILPLPGFPL